MAFIQTETIRSRFLIHVDCLISCSDIATELVEQGLNVYEVRHFSRKSLSDPQPTTSVLVTIFGTSLPSNVK